MLSSFFFFHRGHAAYGSAVNFEDKEKTHVGGWYLFKYNNRVFFLVRLMIDM